MQRSDIYYNIKGCIRYRDQPQVIAWLERAAEKLTKDDSVRLLIDLLEDLFLLRSDPEWNALAIKSLNDLRLLDPSNDLRRRRRFDDKLNSYLLEQERRKAEENAAQAAQIEAKIRANQEREKQRKRSERIGGANAFLITRGIRTDDLDESQILALAVEERESEKIVSLHHDFFSRLELPVSSPPILRRSNAEATQRTPNCYRCRTHLDNSHHLECSRCSWIVCPSCGACDCGYNLR